MSKTSPTRYTVDFYAWALQSAKLLREGNLAAVDVEHIAEELESMGKSERRELINRLAILLAHLLKWQFQPIRQSRSWQLTIQEQRLELQDLLEDSPSLKVELQKRLDHAYDKALIIAEKETGLAKQSFPQQCPFSLKKIFDENFYPGIK